MNYNIQTKRVNEPSEIDNFTILSQLHFWNYIFCSSVTLPALTSETTSSAAAQTLPALTSEFTIFAVTTPEATDATSTTLQKKFRTNLLCRLKNKYHVQQYMWNGNTSFGWT